MSLMPFNREMKRDAFTEKGTCPHCEYYINDDCAYDKHCAVKEPNLVLPETPEEVCQQMEDKSRAKMLMNMHLGVKKGFKTRSPGLDFYNSNQFVKDIQYLGPLTMDEGERIAHAYPHYEFVVQFKSGDFVLFSTDGGDFRALRVMDSVEEEEFLLSADEETYDMATYWEQMNRVIFVPDTKMVWGAPL